jgi:acetyl esterase/lipase
MTPLLITLLALAQPPKTEIVPLWEGKAPHAVGDTKWDKPTVKVFRAPQESANGVGCIICPGGGYGFLADEHEGDDAARFLNKHGVTAFVLQSRVANNERPGPLHPAPMEDAQRAIRHARAKAKEYGLDAKKIGIWGFSAGGHLASTAGTHFDDGKNAGDEIDKVSCRPDFLVLSYPVISSDPAISHKGSFKNLLGDKQDEKMLEYYSNEKQVTEKTPPTFIFHTNEDNGVLPENAVRFYLACKAKKVSCELHLYAKGAHGIGLGTGWKNKTTGAWRIAPEPAVQSWPDRLIEWMVSQKILNKK